MHLSARHCLLAALAGLWITAGAASAQSLRIALRNDPDVLDPTLSRTFTGRLVFAALCDKLFDIDEHLAIVPQLATGYEWADPTTLIIHIRPGVRFQDGEALDAEAVRYSLMRHVTMPGSARLAELTEMQRAEIVDPLTLRIVLKHPSTPFLAQLTDRGGMIVAPLAAEAAGRDFGLHPVCAGPFRFDSRVAQDRIVLTRFEKYWNAQAIHFDSVSFLTMTDPSVRLANLRAGAIDIAEQVAPTDVKTLQADPHFKVVLSDGLGYYGLTNNLGNGPGADNPYGHDARIRQAFELAIDRTALLQVVYEGMFSPTAQAVAATSPYYVSSVQPPPRDPARARALLRQAGAPDPFPLALMVPNAPDLVQVGEVIQSMAAEAGFAVTLVKVEAGAQIQAMKQGQFTASLQFWSGRPDPDGNLYTMLHTGEPQNDGHYSSAIVDRLLDEARRTQGVDARRDLYRAMWAQEAQDLAITYLWTLRNVAGFSASITGFVPIPDGLVRLQGLQLLR